MVEEQGCGCYQSTVPAFPHQDEDIHRTVCAASVREVDIPHIFHHLRAGNELDMDLFCDPLVERLCCLGSHGSTGRVAGQKEDKQSRVA